LINFKYFNYFNILKSEKPFEKMKQKIKYSLLELEKKAYEFRKEFLEIIYFAGSGHPGGSLSAIDVMTYLYFNQMKFDAKKPKWKLRDRFILSKAHACPALYVILAHFGFFPKKELKNLRKFGSILQGHSSSVKTPGVEFSGGSLGQGLSFGNGHALNAKIDNLDYNVYVMLGDGELEEGQIWEAAMTSHHRKLNNLCAIVDKNLLQQTGFTKKIKDIDSVEEKFKAFGWNVISIYGHNFTEIHNAFNKFLHLKKTTKRPTAIISHTIKGKGVSFMELKHEWHGKAPNKKQLNLALKELDEHIRRLKWKSNLQ